MRMKIAWFRQGCPNPKVILSLQWSPTPPLKFLESLQSSSSSTVTTSRPTFSCCDVKGSGTEEFWVKGEVPEPPWYLHAHTSSSSLSHTLEDVHKTQSCVFPLEELSLDFEDGVLVQMWSVLDRLNTKFDMFMQSYVLLADTAETHHRVSELH